MTERGEERDPSQEAFTSPVEADRSNWDALVGSAGTWVSEVKAHVTEFPAVDPEVQKRSTDLISFLGEQVSARNPDTVFLLDILETAAAQSEAQSRRSHDQPATIREQARQVREVQLGYLGNVIDAYKQQA
jgi:hypothetical protein